MDNSINQPLQVGQKIRSAYDKRGWIVKIDPTDGMLLIEVASPQRGWPRDGNIPSNYKAMDTDTYYWLTAENIQVIG
jgi:hypothetical protein